MAQSSAESQGSAEGEVMEPQTTQQLAAGFRAVFRPATDIDDSSEDGFVFLNSDYESFSDNWYEGMPKAGAD